MKRWMPVAAVFLLVTSLARPGLTDQCPQTLTVIFMDDAELTVSEWAFIYEWGERDAPPPPGLISYSPLQKRGRELLLNMGNRVERGVTTQTTRIIPCGQVATIMFDWAESLVFVTGVTVRLSSGEMIRVPDLYPPNQALTSARYVFGKTVRLEGRARLGSEPGEFSKNLLSAEKFPSEPSDAIREIRVGPKR